MPPIPRPTATDYAPYYATYVDKVPERDILQILVDQRDQVVTLLDGIDEEKARYRYAPDKWSIKEVLGHMIDTERLFAFRTLWAAREDPSPQPGMEQDDWVVTGRFDGRTLADLLQEYCSVREASLTLFRSLDEKALAVSGAANEVQFTVRAYPYIVAGHELHHLQVLRERYL